MAKRKKDRLSVTGLVTTVARSVARQRSLKKARELDGAEASEPEPKQKDTRTPEDIRRSVEVTRAELVATVAKVKYDLDVPARARDARDRVAASIPPEWRGERQARAIATSIAAAGLAIVTGIATVAARRPSSSDTTSARPR
ncbi:DUF3618 domain-containing protein [Marisediminicola sp. LYQ85]|uniref:DUF3618 domain-containing protein n=1 Tax=Marisediminicola sp. LYQ85 TaxID=3391062 RepID=UPI003982E716